MAGDDYVARVDAVASLGRLLQQQDEDDLDERTKAEILRLAPEQREAFGQLADALGTALVEAAAAAEAVAAGDEIRSDVSEPALIRTPGVDRDVSLLVWRLAWRSVQRARAPRRSDLLRRSTLLLLINDVELLIANVAREVLRNAPDAVGEDDATLTLKDLELLGDVSRARSMIIERKVDDLLREPFESWVKWFDRFGVDWKQMTDDWLALAELWERRHVVVHSDGKASEQYLKKLRALDGGLPQPAKLDDKLPVDEAYLTAAVERLLAFGLLLVAGTWLQLRKGRQAPALSWLASRVEAVLDDGHPHAAATVTSTVLRTAKGRLPRERELSLRVTNWVARRLIGDEEDVRREVDEWDVGGLALRYAHVKAVISEDYDLAIRQINELLARKEIGVLELVRSPLYGELRESRGSELAVPSTTPIGATVSEE